MISFRCYDPSADGGGGIHGWYDGLRPQYQAEVDATLDLLTLEDHLEGVAEIKPLRGACEGLTEIIVDFWLKKTLVHIRIIGFKGPGRNEFTLLTGFEKSKHNAAYGAHCRSAHQRKDGVERDGRRA